MRGMFIVRLCGPEIGIRFIRIVRMLNLLRAKNIESRFYVNKLPKLEFTTTKSSSTKVKVLTYINFIFHSMISVSWQDWLGVLTSLNAQKFYLGLLSRSLKSSEGDTCSSFFLWFFIYPIQYVIPKDQSHPCIYFLSKMM